MLTYPNPDQFVRELFAAEHLPHSTKPILRGKERGGSLELFLARPRASSLGYTFKHTSIPINGQGDV